MAIPKSVAALAVIVALLGSGCTQPDPNAAPTYTCTPSDGSTPAPCYKAEHDQQVKEDALYAEAEAVYRKYIAEEERINRIGGIEDPTKVLLDTTTGSYLASAMKAYRALKAAKATASGGKFDLAWVRRTPSDVRDGSIATLSVCLDTSSVSMGSKGNEPQPGRITQRTAYFVRIGDTLKIAHGKYLWVAEC
ncbi:MAG TPA: hypothetical protein PKD84_12830 [Propionicimonas sp.]|nr:hypothetical protein [Propionicimonas sp.]